MKKVIAIVGPTGSGKSALAVKLAQYLNTDVISGDSVQVYRSLDIGSAKIKNDEKMGINHHLIDIIEPEDEYTAFSFQKDARKIIDELTENGKIPIFCGGTGFYLKSALYDYSFVGSGRNHEFDNLTNEEIYSRLISLNDKEIPDSNNRKRLLRHLEIYSSGDSVKYDKNEPLYDILLIGLTMPREKLYTMINKRVDKMIQDGLLDEVKSLKERGLDQKIDAIGYKELFSYLKGDYDIDTAINLIKQHTRNFAKRQYTWFNHQMMPHWIDVSEKDPYFEAKQLVDIFIKKSE